MSVAFFSAPASAQLLIGPATASSADFATWTGTGFDPVPIVGHADSDLWRPFGTGVPPTMFGGTCATGICARGVASAGTAVSSGPGFYAIMPAGTFPTVNVLAMHASDTGLSPGGVELRMIDGDPSATITRIQLEVDWALRLGIATSSDTLVMTSDDCGLHGVHYPLTVDVDAVAMTPGTIRWQTHQSSVTIDTSAAPLTPGGIACVAFTIGTMGGLRDVVAIGRVSVTVPAAACGNGVVEPPNEECEPTAGATACACDPSCHFPTGACTDNDTNPCTSGHCAAGACVPVGITSTSYVAACDHDGNACTFEGCVAGACAALPGCVPESLCFTCDPTTLSCEVPVHGRPGCCASDADCDGPCMIGTCDRSTGACTAIADPTCRDAGPPDGGALPGDAGADGGASTSDGGTSGRDASAGLDGGEAPPQVGFGGGGGCRCQLGSTSPGGLAALVFGLLSAAYRWRSGRRQGSS